MAIFFHFLSHENYAQLLINAYATDKDICETFSSEKYQQLYQRPFKVRRKDGDVEW